MEKIKSEQSPFTNLVHIGIVVKDIKKAVNRLESLGIGPFQPLILPPFIGELEFRGKTLKPNLKELIANVGNISIVLFEPGEGDSSWREFLDTKGEGIQHLAFAVEDLDGQIAKLTAQGVKSLGGIKWEGGGGGFYFDPEVGGMVLELFKA
jgi:methylmalonyl-CoA/ethylmalonyl-CoA epimerase